MFLNAFLLHEIYCKQIPGFSEANKIITYCLFDALYSLKQSFYEWYKVIHCALYDLELSRCKVNHTVFIGYFPFSSDLTITMSDGSDLFIIIYLHVNDGLNTTNSISLYE